MAARKRSGRRGEQHATKDVGGQLLLSFDLLESLLPIGGSELEDALVRPARQQAEHVAQIGERLDVVEPGAGKQRNEDRVDPGAVIAADEEPVSTAEDLPP